VAIAPEAVPPWALFSQHSRSFFRVPLLGQHRFLKSGLCLLPCFSPRTAPLIPLFSLRVLSGLRTSRLIFFFVPADRARTPQIQLVPPLPPSFVPHAPTLYRPSFFPLIPYRELPFFFLQVVPEIVVLAPSAAQHFCLHSQRGPFLRVFPD